MQPVFAVQVRDGVAQQKLRVTTTNAFAGRWLVPRLPLWRQTHPEIALEVIGTDTVIDLATGNADVAIRYAFAPPPGLATSELLRDRFWPVASPKLLPGGKAIRRPSDLAGYPIIHAWWPDTNPHAPTWQRWLVMAQRIDARVSLDMSANGLTFAEELHAIEAVSPDKASACSAIFWWRTSWQPANWSGSSITPFPALAFTLPTDPIIRGKPSSTPLRCGFVRCGKTHTLGPDPHRFAAPTV
jgi:hypothetical protein